jgi:phosphatidylglycerol:prolipoprotein diacylglycerol transferase
MFPVLHIGPFSLQAPGLALVVAAWFGLSLAEKTAPRFKANPERLYTLVTVAFLAGILGGRFIYVFRYFSAFRDAPLSAFSLNLDLFDAAGGAVFALLGGAIYARKYEMPAWETLDALTPFFAVLWIGAALSHIASGKAFGAPTTLPWGIFLWDATRHPSQFYELFAAALTLFLLSRAWRAESPSGTIFLRFLAWISGWTLFLDAFRGDLPNPVFAQAAAWILLAISFYLLDAKFSGDRA